MAPTPHDFTIVRGDAWNDTFQLYSDAANTHPFDLTGWTGLVAVVLPSPLLLTAPPGLVMGGSAGTLTPLVTAAQSTGVRVSACRWYMRITDPNGLPKTIVNGVITWSDP